MNIPYTAVSDLQDMASEGASGNNANVGPSSNESQQNIDLPLVALSPVGVSLDVGPTELSVHEEAV